MLPKSASSFKTVGPLRTRNGGMWPPLLSSIELFSALGRFLVQEVFFPPLANDHDEVAEDSQHHDADQEKVLLKEAYTLGFLLNHFS